MDTNETSNPEVQAFGMAPMGKGAALSTWLILVGMAIGVVGLAVLSGVLGGFWVWTLRILAGVLAVGLIGLVVMVRTYSRPSRYELSPEGLKIIWPGRSRKLPRAAFAEMRIITLTEIGILKRKFAISGIFGSFGWFRSAYLGNIDAYTTRNDGLVYLKLKNRHPLILTPKDPQEFLRVLGEMVEKR